MDPTARTGARPVPRAPAPPDAGPLGRAALVVVLVLVAILATSLAGPWDPPLRGDDDVPLTLPTVTATAPPPPAEDPLADALADVDVEPWDLTWLGVALSVVAGVGAVLLAIRVWRWWPRRLPEDHPDDAGVEQGTTVGLSERLPDLPSLSEGVRDADVRLAARVPPSDAVIAAWVALEGAAERSGVVRDPASTPTEFTVAVLDRAPVDPAAVRVLLDLYLRARFGTDALGSDDVAAASDALRTLARGLAAAAERPGRDDDADDDAAGLVP